MTAFSDITDVVYEHVGANEHKGSLVQESVDIVNAVYNHLSEMINQVRLDYKDDDEADLLGVFEDRLFEAR